jgi:hypothetical protein
MFKNFAVSLEVCKKSCSTWGRRYLRIGRLFSAFSHWLAAIRRKTADLSGYTI